MAPRLLASFLIATVVSAACAEVNDPDDGRPQSGRGVTVGDRDLTKITREGVGGGDLATIGAAYALGHGARTGSIEVGKQADFVILDRNIFDGPIAEIHEAEVMMTALDKSPVFER